MDYALINASKIVNVCVVDDVELLDLLTEFEHKIRIDTLDPIPGIDWDYDPNTDTFVDNRPSPW